MTLSDGDDQETGAEPLTYRLATTLTDPDQAPAAELAELYSQRWEIESAFDELKTHQRSPRIVLRSKLPDGVRQEVYGYLCVHYAIRWLMHSVASESDTDPDRLSFTRTLRAARRTIVSHPGFSPRTLADAYHQLAVELEHELLPARRHRTNPRVVRRKMSNFPVKRPEHRARQPHDHQTRVVPK